VDYQDVPRYHAAYIVSGRRNIELGCNLKDEPISAIGRERTYFRWATSEPKRTFNVGN